jgi:hypothetical protein
MDPTRVLIYPILHGGSGPRRTSYWEIENGPPKWHQKNKRAPDRFRRPNRRHAPSVAPLNIDSGERSISCSVWQCARGTQRPATSRLRIRRERRLTFARDDFVWQVAARRCLQCRGATTRVGNREGQSRHHRAGRHGARVPEGCQSQV